jgi:hypothetical protein
MRARWCTEPAFGNLKFWQSIGAICPFVWGPLISFQVKLIIVGSTLCLATISVLILDLKVRLAPLLSSYTKVVVLRVR